MEPDKTVEPGPAEDVPAGEPSLPTGPVEPAAQPLTAEGVEGADAGATELAEDDDSLSDLAPALIGDRAAFLTALGDILSVIAPNLGDASRRAMRLGPQSAADEAEAEAAADNRITTVLSADAERSAAVAVCAALAARHVARALEEAEGGLERADCATLLAAWSDAAHRLDAAHGAEGLRTLLPIARPLARRVAGRGEPTGGIASVVRHVAARIADDPSLVRALAASTTAVRPSRSRRGMPGPPRRIVLQGPVEIAFHPR